MTTTRPVTLHLRSRWARRLSLVWFAAAAVWAFADGVSLATGGGLTWDVIAVPVLLAVGIGARRVSLDVDEDGFVVHEGLRSHRVLWAAVDRVEIDWQRRFDAPVRVHLTRDDRPLALHATWGLRPAEREALLAVLRPAAARHDIVVEVR